MSSPITRPTVESLGLEDKEQVQLYLELIRIIEKDIDEIKAGDARSGWTSWAIIGGIAAALSLFFGETRKLQMFPMEEVKTIGLGIILFLQAAMMTLLIPNINIPGIRPGRVRWSRDANFSYIPRVVFRFLITLVLIFIAFTLSLTLWMKIILLVTLISWALFLLLMLILILMNHPLGNTGTSRKGALYYVLILTPLSLAGFIILLTKMPFPTGETATLPYILAGLLIALLFLVDNLISTSVPSRLLSNLYDLKNDIIFLRVDIDEALQRYEILTEGETLPDALKAELGDILNHLNFIDYAHSNMATLLEKMSREIPTQGDSEAEIAAKRQQLKLDKDSYSLHDEKTTQVLNSLTEKLKKLNKKMSKLLAASEDRANENTIRSLLVQRIQLLQADQAALAQRLRPIDFFINNPTQLAPPLSPTPPDNAPNNQQPPT
jgi:hypothetical protein